MLVAGFLGGAAWGLIPGVLRARFGVNEIIATLMLNSIAFAWIQYWVFGPWTEGGFQLTEQFPVGGLAAPPERLRRGVPGVRAASPSTRASSSRWRAAVVVWWIVERSRLGYEIRLIGDNPRAARYAGIPIARIILLVFAVSGGLAGIAGMAEVSGRRPPAPGQLLAGLRLHGDHRRVPREVPSAAGRPGGDPVRGARPRRPRDPAVRGAGDDPGDHPVLPDLERGVPALPRPHRAAACRLATAGPRAERLAWTSS